jgi:hypothetical protein
MSFFLKVVIFANSLYSIAMSPSKSAQLVAAYSDVRCERILKKTCRRESRCRPVKKHRVDAHLSKVVWENAVRRGYLEPSCQPYHEGWSTRGSFGLMAAYHVKYLPFGGYCLPAEVFDIPLVSAYASMKKIEKICGKNTNCTYDYVRDFWNGRGYRNAKARKHKNR